MDAAMTDALMNSMMARVLATVEETCRRFIELSSADDELSGRELRRRLLTHLGQGLLHAALESSFNNGEQAKH